MCEYVAGCEAGRLVVVGEGVARCSEALGALSEGFSSKGTSSIGSCPGCTPSAPISTAFFSFSFSLPSDGPTDSPLKAAPSPSRESSMRAIKDNEGTGSSGPGSPAGLGTSAGLAGAVQGAVFSAVSLVSMLYFFALHVLVVLHGAAGTQRLKISATRKLKQASTVDGFDDIVFLCASACSCCFLMQLRSSKY